MDVWMFWVFTWTWNELNVISFQNDLVLYLGHGAGNSWVHVDTTYNTFAQEVTDFDQSALLADGSVDGKVSIYETHLVLVALDDSLNQILDVCANGADSGNFLLGTEPLLDFDLLLANLGDVNSGVLEVALKSTTWALDGHSSWLDKNLDWKEQTTEFLINNTYSS